MNKRDIDFKDSNYVYTRLNYLTILGMVLVFTVHFCNNKQISAMGQSNQIIQYIRGFSYVAVPLFIGILGYTYLYRGKKINLANYFVYIFLPSLVVASIDAIIKGRQISVFSFYNGLEAHYFGMVILSIFIFLPTFNKIIKKINPWYIVIPFYIFSVLVVLIEKNQMVDVLGYFMALAYIPLMYIIVKLVFNKVNNNLLNLLIIVCCTYLIGKAYYVKIPIFYTLLFKSYISVPSILMVSAIMKLFLNFRFKIPSLLFISKTSYFFYLIHFLVLNRYMGPLMKTDLNLVVIYLIMLSLSLAASYLIYISYDFIIKKLDIL